MSSVLLHICCNDDKSFVLFLPFFVFVWRLYNVSELECAGLINVHPFMNAATSGHTVARRFLPCLLNSSRTVRRSSSQRVQYFSFLLLFQQKHIVIGDECQWGLTVRFQHVCRNKSRQNSKTWSHDFVKGNWKLFGTLHFNKPSSWYSFNNYLQNVLKQVGLHLHGLVSFYTEKRCYTFRAWSHGMAYECHS